MLEYGITMTRLSKDDLIDIGDYIAYTLGVPDTALQFIEGIREVISTLSQTPERGALIRDKVLSEQGVRWIPYKNYYIFYEVLEEIGYVVVLRIGYNRRNWKNILRDS